MFSRNAFSTTLTAQMGPTDLTATVASTTGITSPTILCIDPEDAAKREYIVFDDTFTGTSFVCSDINQRYQTGSAAGSGITHESGAEVRAVPAAQMFEDVHDRLEAHRHTGGTDGLTIQAGGLAASAVTEAKIATDAVTADKIAAGAVGTSEIAADAVDGTKIADDSIDSEHYVDGSIDTAHIANAQVTADKLATGAQADSVDTSETTTSTSYTDLATSGPEVTVTVGANGLLLVCHSCELGTNSAGNGASADFALSGANTRSAQDGTSLRFDSAIANVRGTSGRAVLLTGLSAGSTTVTMKYKTAGATTGTFVNRVLSVIPL